MWIYALCRQLSRVAFPLPLGALYLTTTGYHPSSQLPNQMISVIDIWIDDRFSTQITERQGTAMYYNPSITSIPHKACTMHSYKHLSHVIFTRHKNVGKVFPQSLHKNFKCQLHLPPSQPSLCGHLLRLIISASGYGQQLQPGVPSRGRCFTCFGLQIVNKQLIESIVLVQ